MNLLSKYDVKNALFIFVECVAGVLKFTLEPPDPSYATNGCNAKMVWDYSVDNQAELLGIIFSVKRPSGGFTGMLVKSKDGIVTTHQRIPAAYQGRVRTEGKATLVIESVTPHDNTQFRCTLASNNGTDVKSVIQLIVTST